MALSPGWSGPIALTVGEVVLRADWAQGELRSCAISSESHIQEVMGFAQSAVIASQSGLLAAVVGAMEGLKSQRLMSATYQSSGRIDTSWSLLGSGVRLFWAILIFGV